MRERLKKSCRIGVVIAALSILFCAASIALAQKEPIAGGYAETSMSDPEVVSAARYAVRRQGQKERARISLISIRRAEVQVVAGLNYRLDLRVSAGGKAQDATVVVYKNLKRKYSLSSWEVNGSRAGSAPASSNSTIEQLVKSLAEAYTSKTLGKLDAETPYLRKIRIVIEHSLAEEGAKDSVEVKEFRTLAQAERWLRSREISEGVPARGGMPLEQCSKGVCTFDFNGGILHNHLYLQEIRYGYRRGRPYIKTIFLLDGD